MTKEEIDADFERYDGEIRRMGKLSKSQNFSPFDKRLSIELAASRVDEAPENFKMNLAVYLRTMKYKEIAENEEPLDCNCNL